MTKSTITREQLIKKAQEQIEFCRHTKITGEGRVHVNQCAALFEIALAAIDSEPVAWLNGCNKSVPAALRYLAENPRPIGGESSFNAAHLYQLAREIELMAEAPLYRHAQPASELKPVGYLFVSGQGAIAYSPTDWGMPGFKLAGQIFGDIAVESQPTPVVPDVMEPTIEAIKRILPTSNPDEYAACIGADMWNACRAAMLNQKQCIKCGRVELDAQPAQVWIPVSERMPENNPGCYEYLVFETLNNQVNHDYWNVPDRGDDAFTPFWNYYGEHVTHWMPLPVAPQEVSHD
ncbi:DUF551 domain-containing protein [Klebsiella oxytoca]|uniref:DUF551 domain-containing protein n=1 Tax=Klebsiella oxytoca TaxID=571 RepID=UPI0031203B14